MKPKTLSPERLAQAQKFRALAARLRRKATKADARADELGEEE